MNLFDRIKGGLYGVAVGDALGGTTEFMTRSEIKRKYGYLTEIVGGGVWQLEPGEVTDDTMMTLCVAEGILAQPQEPTQAVGERFLDWYRSNPKDIGNIIRYVFSLYEGNWFEASLLAHQTMGQSAGNGSLMRCLPIALAYSSQEDIEQHSRVLSKMTHYDERCNEACVLYNRIAHRLMAGSLSLPEAIEREIRGTEYADILHTEPNCEPNGFVVHTFRWVLHILSNSSSFEEVVQKAANLGGDSDTIGAIAGGLAGVHYGYGGISKPYSSKVLIRNRLDGMSERLLHLRTKPGER